jgi:hypothetical protein
VAGICEYGNEHSGSLRCGEFLTGCKPVSFSRRTVLHGVSNYIANDLFHTTKCSTTESLHKQLYGIFSCIHISSLVAKI